jgi:hypothetical protein
MPIGILDIVNPNVQCPHKYQVDGVCYEEDRDYTYLDDEFHDQHTSLPGNPEVMVAVIDDGIDMSVPYFSNRARLMLLDEPNTGKFQPETPSHGSKCASIAIWGSPYIKLLAFKTARQAGQGSLGFTDSTKEVKLIKENVLSKLREETKCRVVSYSLGAGGQKGAQDWAGVADMVKAAANTLFVFGAGNQPNDLDKNGIWEPASSCSGLPNVIVVGGIDCKVGNDRKPSNTTKDVNGGTMTFGFGSGGKTSKVNIAAFGNFLDEIGDGKGVRCLDPSGIRGKFKPMMGNKWSEHFSFVTPDYDTGVSFAVPQVANVTAKMFLLDPTLTAAEVKEIILRTATTHPNLAALNSTSGYLNPKGCYDAVRVRK